MRRIVPGKIRNEKGVANLRGVRPVVTINSAKKFAERQGYCWVPNPDTDLPYDALACHDQDAITIRVRTCRNSPGEFDMWEDFFREDFVILKLLPIPEGIGRELWVRYVWSQAFKRYRVHEDRLHEITMINREKPVYKKGVKFRSDPSNIQPIRRHPSEYNLNSVSQSDKENFRFRWKCVNTCGRYRYNSLFFEKLR